MSKLELPVRLSPLKIEPKSAFEEALDKLDLQGLLLMLTIISQKALYLQSKETLDGKKAVLRTGQSPIVTKNIIHG